MPYNFVADGFHTKKLCSRLSLSAVQFYEKTAIFAVFSSPLRDLGTMYDVHLGLIRKCIVNFLLVLIELFLLGVTAEALRANVDWKSTFSLHWGPVDPKFQVEGVASTHHSSSHKTRLNALSYGIKIWTYISSILSQSTHLTNRETDRILIARPRLHSMQCGKNCNKQLQLYVDWLLEFIFR